MTRELLQIKELKTYFYTHLGVAKAVDDLDLQVNQGDILGIVGESGCGKSVTALSIMRLLPEAVWSLDEPMADPSSVPMMAISRLAAEHVKVVLSGEGADELCQRVGEYFPPGKPAVHRQRDGDRRVEVRAGDIADGKA